VATNKLKIQQVVPELYPRLVQYINGVFYDGNGNVITVNTSSSRPGNNYFVQEPPAPTAKYVGDRWFDLSTGIEFVWNFDGNSYQWVQFY
jgi:hypothetical protein